MLSIILDQFIKKSKFKDSIIRLSFFTFQGLLASVLLADGIKLLYGDLKNKEEIEYGIASAIAFAPFLSDRLAILGKKTNNIAVGFGMFLGTTIASKSCDI